VYSVDGSSIIGTASGGYTATTLTVGAEYFIQVQRQWTSFSGQYQIAFNDSFMAPGVSATALSVNSFAAGTGTQWYRFTASAAAQYIHFKPGTAASGYVRVLNADGSDVGTEGLSLYTPFTKRSLTSGTEYYIRVSVSSGTYQIAFNDSFMPPGAPSASVQLTVDTWAAGSLAAGAEQWFNFTASAATQYIHFKTGTVTTISVRIFAADGTVVGTDSASLSSSVKYTTRTLTPGTEYYIRAWPGSGSGAYQIAFTDSSMNPDESWPPAAAAALTADTWENGLLAETGEEQWFSLTASAAAQHIHFKAGTAASILVRVYAADGTIVGEDSTSLSSSGGKSAARTLSIGEVYYIRVWSVSTGTYQIAFSASAMPPGVTAEELTEDVWASGSLAEAGAEQWYRFTATAAEQYIHGVEGGGLWWMYVQVFDTEGASVGGQASIESRWPYTTRTLAVGEVYYIRVRPGGSTGTFQIAFNDSTTPPS
jgi:hypothetical protein